MKEKITIIGAGLSGSLLAVLLKKRGYEVELFERRPDLRTTDISAGRSINLALSSRGLRALAHVGMEEKVMKTTIPMKGRLLHDELGNLKFSAYSGREGENINSVSRGGLNALLLDEAEKLGIPIHFNTKCTKANLQSGELTFKRYLDNEYFNHPTEICIGTDGSGSAIREAMFDDSRELLFSFSQHYLTHGYKELHIDPSEDGGFKMEKNALHIWPRGNNMLIALPNEDGSFTVTLFLDFEGENGFNNLDSDEKILSFFKTNFSDALDLMPDLVKTFNDNPTGALATIKCYPWQANGRFLLVGDAAHAVVPFYGQGMNASFEDCLVLDDCINENEGDWEAIFKAYEQKRKKDADAIGDLAEENFYEMSAHTADPIFAKKRVLERKMEETFPDYYSKYSMVTFNPSISYSEAMIRGRKQDELLLGICRGKEDVESINLEEVLKQVKGIEV